MLLFIMRYNVVRTFESVNPKLCGHSNESYPEVLFSVVLFIMLYRMVLTFESVYEILKCDHLNESYQEYFAVGSVYYAVQGGSNF